MSDVTIYHNPRCSKSRQTLALLEEHGVEADVVEYLKDTPTAAELDAILKKLGKRPEEIVRKKEARLAELGISPSDQLSRDEWLKTFSENPILIERPIVVAGQKAALGRPPEAVLELFYELP